MQLRNLGVINGPVLLFGGPYSNRQALRALLDVARVLGIGPDAMICTGDVVAYGGAPAATVAMIRAAGCAVIAGNCEIQLAQDAPDCGCGFEPGSACDLLSPGWYGHARAQLSAGDRAWMGALPRIIVFSHQGARYAVLHGGATDVARFVWPRSPEDIFAQEWPATETIEGPVDTVIAGHCGIPFQRDTRVGRWINSGAIGMPPHDGRQQTRYAVLDGGEVVFRRLTYDVEGAVTDMIEAGLTQGYHTSLRSGYWPSEDVLPSDLRVPSLANG